MSDIRELYQQLIIDHGRHPRNFGKLTSPTHTKEGFNPLCGDKITIYIDEKDGVIEKIAFEGSGCAISMASASLMTDSMKGKSIAQFDDVFSNFHHLVTDQPKDASLQEKLGKLAVLSGVAEFPMRVKCATLCWHTARAALHADHKAVSTE